MGGSRGRAGADPGAPYAASSGAQPAGRRARAAHIRGLCRQALGLWLAAALVWIGLSAGAAAQSTYRIQPGDTLRVEVLEDATINRTVLVLPDGRISFPLVGTLRAGGLSVAQVQSALADRLAPSFASTPNVFVAVVGLAPPVERAPVAEVDDRITVYLLGEVSSPGPKQVPPGTTVLQLLSESGGFTQFAATKRLQLRRRDPRTGRERLYKIDYRAISRGAALSQDPPLQPGDVLLVPERRLFE